MVNVALDGGQSGLRALATDERGLHQTFDLAAVRTNSPLHPQLATAITEVASQLAAPVDTVSIGTTGLTGPDADARGLLTLLAPLGIRQVLLAHDSITSYLGALGQDLGAVVAAGTGVVTLAVGPSSIVRVDGWGHIMGDAGSGFWIGREALRAAMRAHDGRGPATPLLDLIRERWPDVENAYVALQSDPDWVRTVASFARPTAEVADVDPVAGAICTSAADELAASAVTALTRADLVDRPDQTPVAMVGNVFSSARVRNRFEQILRTRLPRATVTSPLGTGLDGAALLPDLPPDHPLVSRVSRATSIQGLS